jgi:hypothetical protein
MNLPAPRQGTPQADGARRLMIAFRLEFGAGVGIDLATQRDFLEFWLSPLHSVKSFTRRPLSCQERVSTISFRKLFVGICTELLELIAHSAYDSQPQPESKKFLSTIQARPETQAKSDVRTNWLVPDATGSSSA